MQAFGIMKSTFRGSPSEYYELLSHPLHLAKLTTYVTQTIIGDAVVVRSLSQISDSPLTSFLADMALLHRIQ